MDLDRVRTQVNSTPARHFATAKCGWRGGKTVHRMCNSPPAIHRKSEAGGQKHIARPVRFASSSTQHAKASARDRSPERSARHGPPPTDVPRGYVGRRAPCRWCRQAPATPRDRDRAAGRGEAPSGHSIRDLAPMKSDPCAVLRDRRWAAIFLGTARRAALQRALADPVGFCCPRLRAGAWGPERRRRILLAQAVGPDGVGRARLGCSVRSPSGTRRRRRRAVGQGVESHGTVGCSVRPTSPEAGSDPRRRSMLAVAGCQVRACREDRLGKAPPLFRAGALAGSGGVSRRPVLRGAARGVSQGSARLTPRIPFNMRESRDSTRFGGILACPPQGIAVCSRASVCGQRP